LLQSCVKSDDEISTKQKWQTVNEAEFISFDVP
jgi:hypothetical protein